MKAPGIARAAAIAALAIIPTVALAAPSHAYVGTLSCGTGGYWYMTDSMFVKLANVGGAHPWKYTVTRSANRNVYTGSTYVKHTTTLINRYTNGSVTHFWNPGNTVTWYSTSRYEDVGMFVNVEPSGGPLVQKKCYVWR